MCCPLKLRHIFDSLMKTIPLPLTPKYFMSSISYEDTSNISLANISVMNVMNGLSREVAQFLRSHGDRAPNYNMGHIFKVGCHFVSAEKLIHFNHL